MLLFCLWLLATSLLNRQLLLLIWLQALPIWLLALLKQRHLLLKRLQLLLLMQLHLLLKRQLLLWPMLLPVLPRQQLLLLKRLLLLLVKLLPLQYLSKFYFEILVLNKSHRKVAFIIYL